MDLSKIFYRTIGGEYNSILLHFGKLQQYFFYFKTSDARASENLSPSYLVAHKWPEINPDQCLYQPKITLSTVNWSYLSRWCKLGQKFIAVS